MSKTRVIYFNNNVEETAKKVEKYVRGKYWPWYRRSGQAKLKDLNLISGQYYFIILLLYFYEKLPVKLLVENIRKIYLEKYSSEAFDIIYGSAVKRLFKSGMIKKEESLGNGNLYKLTDKGYNFAQRLLSYVPLKNKTSIIDKMRLQIMYGQYY